MKVNDLVSAINARTDRKLRKTYVSMLKDFEDCPAWDNLEHVWQVLLRTCGAQHYYAELQLCFSDQARVLTARSSNFDNSEGQSKAEDHRCEGHSKVYAYIVRREMQFDEVPQRDEKPFWSESVLDVGLSVSIDAACVDGKSMMYGFIADSNDIVAHLVPTDRLRVILSSC